MGPECKFGVDMRGETSILVPSMHSDLEKLLSLKKINPAMAEQLDQFSPGRYCLHRTWGTGKVLEWNLPKKELLIDFEGKKEDQHPMGLGFAMKNLTPLASDHFRIKRYEELAHLQSLVKTNPLELLRIVIKGHGGTIKPEEIESSLKGSVIPEGSFKTWWDKTKTLARSGTEFIVPTRKGELIRIREGELSQAAALLSDYESSRDLKVRVRILEGADAATLKTEPEKGKALLKEVEADIERGGKLALQQVLELAVLRDELLAGLPAEYAMENTEPLEDLLTNFDEGRLVYTVIAAIPGARQKKIYETFPKAFGDKWEDEALFIFDNAGTRAIGEVAKFLLESPAKERFLKHLKEGVFRHSLHTDALIWICRERDKGAAKVFGMEVGFALLAHLEKDHSETGNSGVLRLKNYMMDNADLIPDMLQKKSTNEVRRFAKALLNCPALPELDRKSLFARILKVCPSVHELILGNQTEEEDVTLIVSWSSLRRKKQELEEIITVKQPENVNDIAVARSHGDLRENGDYKAAKEEQTKLARQRAELERDIQLARGTDFSDPDTSSVNIGTIVEMTTADGKKVTYTVLGAWDSEPEKNIVSYKTALGQKFLGLKPGDSVDIYLNDKDVTCTVTSIKAAPTDLAE